MSGPEIGLKPASAVLTIVRGDQWERPLVLKVGDAAYNATGTTLTASVSRQQGGPVLFAPAITTVNASLGQYRIDISEAQSETLTAATPRDPRGEHWLTLRLLDAAGVTTTLAQVQMQVLP